jgi:hypothetical protein
MGFMNDTDGRRVRPRRNPNYTPPRERPINRRLLVEAEVVTYLQRHYLDAEDDQDTQSQKKWRAAYASTAAEFLASHRELRKEYERWCEETDDLNDCRTEFSVWLHKQYLDELYLPPRQR